MPVDIPRPKVALIGRPNVGKSTLYNRLIGRESRRGGRAAIVDELAGVTRDRLYGVCEWDGYEFTVIDCGGIGPESQDPLWGSVTENSRLAMAEADLILFMTDARTGITTSDEALLKELRRQKKPVVVAVNKVDSPKQEADASEFWSLGYPDLCFIAGQSGRGSGELLDLVVARLDWTDYPLATPAHARERYGDEDEDDSCSGGVQPPSERDGRRLDAAATGEDEEFAPEDADPGADYPFAWGEIERPRFVPDESWREEPLRLVLVGRQNVGKSSLTNALLGETRSLVADLPGTTRDALFGRFERGGQAYELLDTAGMKRISRLKEDVDFYSLVRAEKGLKGSEVALLVLDAEAGITEQDKRVAAKIEELGRAVVIVVNKADLIVLPESEYGHLQPRTPQPVKGGRPKAARIDNASLLTQVSQDLQAAYIDYVRFELGKLGWAHLVFVSALEGWGLDAMLAAAGRARGNHHRRLDNKVLRALLDEAVALNPPPVVKNQVLRILDFRQIGNCPPAFLLEVNHKRAVRQAYERYIVNTLRKHFDFEGAHLRLVVYERRKGGR